MLQARRIELVQNQLDAYNKKDIELFCQQYHSEVEVYARKTSTTAPELISKGIERFKEIYVNRFKDAQDLHCELVSRIVLGDHVIDEESVQTIKGQPRIHVVAVYGFQDNLIKTVLFLR